MAKAYLNGQILQQRSRTALHWAGAIALSTGALSISAVPELNSLADRLTTQITTLLSETADSGETGEADFETSLSFVRGEEGAISDHQNDIGGLTSHGITGDFLQTHGEEAGVQTTEVTSLSQQEIDTLYRFIWDEANCAQFAPPLDTTCLDTATQFYFTGWWEFLSEVEGIAESDPKTAAIKIAESRYAYRDQRVAESPSQADFIDGWKDRDLKLKAFAKAYSVQLPEMDGNAPYVFPLLGKNMSNADVTSEWGWRFGGGDRNANDRNFHEGIDLACAYGEPLVAVTSGTLFYYNSDPNGYGPYTIYIEGVDGYEYLYGHNQDRLVPDGSLVKAGDVVASCGSEGNSSGPHLHFERYLDSTDPKNPRPFLEQIK